MFNKNRALWAIVLSLFACTPAKEQGVATEVSGEPNLVVSEQGEVYLSWIENKGALRLSSLQNGVWSTPQTIATGDNWFVNWADFPAVAVLRNGSLAAHWLVKSGGSPYAYDVVMAFSRDGGATWSEPMSPHRDGTKTEHGFVSMIPWQQDRLMAVWLDGRNTLEQPDGSRGAMTLRYAILDDSGTIHEQGEIDSRTCECCQTALAATPTGAIAAYRDRSETEIRDIAIVRYADGRWQEPRLIHEDGWKIYGCPVNGPALASLENAVALAWYTNAGGTARVNLSISTDGGETFSPPQQVDEGKPIGRVDVVWLGPQEVMVSWMERIDEETAEIRYRRISLQQGASPSELLTKISAARSSGFPRMVVSGETLVFAWTDPGTPPQVKTRILRISEMAESSSQ